MTIALSLKVNDGVALATDSASTLMEVTPKGRQIRNVFNHANKVFNLRKGLPIGAITWGLGAIGRESTSTLMKDLRRRLAGNDPSKPDWEIDPKSYSIQRVAELLREFMYDEKYLPAYGKFPDKPTMGFIVAGYSSGSAMADEFVISVDSKGVCGPVVATRPSGVCGLSWQGEPDAIHRLFFGVGLGIGPVMEHQLGIDPKMIPPAIDILKQNLRLPIVEDAMPIQDALDLAEFLVDLTSKVSRFTPGASTVGGPIELAAITKHEGFKWVRRKYYYSNELNPGVAHV